MSAAQAKMDDASAFLDEPDTPSPSMISKKYAPPTAVCMALHRNLLVAPLLGVGCRLGKHCVPVMEIPKVRMDVALAASVATDSDSAQATPQPLYSWKALNSICVTLLKHRDDATAIYVHPSDMHYSASPIGSLGRACPTGTALLAQVPFELAFKIC